MKVILISDSDDFNRPLNLISGKRINLPAIKGHVLRNVDLSSPPTSDDYIIIGNAQSNIVDQELMTMLKLCKKGADDRGMDCVRQVAISCSEYGIPQG